MKQLFPDPPRPELKTETVAGHTLQYAELDRAGSPRILFIHGSPGEWQAFDSYLNRPELQVYGPLLAPDRPGYGGSEPHVVVASLEEQARRLAPLLLGNGAPAIVVGHSLGGPIAAKLAMDYPDRVRGLLLLAPSVAPALEAPRWYQRLATRSEEHTSELQSLMRISYAVFCVKKKKKNNKRSIDITQR